MASTLILLAAAALGLSAGALLTEGAVLVPFWRSLPPDSFLDWYRENGARLLRFFGPLEILAALLACLAAGASWLQGSSHAPLLAVSGCLALGVVGTFPVYFQRANASFAEATIESDRVEDELRRWSRWHWARVGLAAAAFLAALLALVAATPGAAS